MNGLCPKCGHPSDGRCPTCGFDTDIPPSAERQLNEMRTEIEKHRNRILQDVTASTDELPWLTKLLENCPRLALMQLARQTRFLIERETTETTLAALKLLTEDYCLTCGEYVGKYSKGCDCA